MISGGANAVDRMHDSASGEHDRVDLRRAACSAHADKRVRVGVCHGVSLDTEGMLNYYLRGNCSGALCRAVLSVNDPSWKRATDMKEQRI